MLTNYTRPLRRLAENTPLSSSSPSSPTQEPGPKILRRSASSYFENERSSQKSPAISPTASKRVGQWKRMSIGLVPKKKETTPKKHNSVENLIEEKTSNPLFNTQLKKNSWFVKYRHYIWNWMFVMIPFLFLSLKWTFFSFFLITILFVLF